MHRPDHATKDPNFDGLGHAGYTEGDPGLGIPRTVVTKDQANEWTEGLCRLVEKAGITLTKNDFDQLGQAVSKVGAPRSQVQNLLINGGFDIWQNDTSFSFDSTAIGDPPQAQYTADQWYCKLGNNGVTGAGTVAKTTLAVGAGGALRSTANALVFTQTIGASPGVPQIEQRIDMLEELDGQTVTLQVRGKVAASTLTVTPYLVQNFGSGGSTSVNVIGSAWTWDTTLKLYTCTFTVPSISGKTVGADAYTAIGWFFPASTTFTATMAAAQLEPGDVASDFVALDPAIELLRAQRFFFKTYDPASIPTTITTNGELTGENSGTNASGINVAFPVPMRKVPAVTWYSPATGTKDKIERPVGSGDLSVSSTVGTGQRRSGYPVTSSPGGSVLAAAHLVADARF